MGDEERGGHKGALASPRAKTCHVRVACPCPWWQCKRLLLYNLTVFFKLLLLPTEVQMRRNHRDWHGRLKPIDKSHCMHHAPTAPAASNIDKDADDRAIYTTHTPTHPASRPAHPQLARVIETLEDTASRPSECIHPVQPRPSSSSSPPPRVAGVPSTQRTSKQRSRG